jgi:hypothetical protein
MPDRAHPALAVEISIATARRLFPGTSYGTFWWHCRETSAGPRLTFGEAYRAAAQHWAGEALAAQAARFSVTHRQTWKARRASAAKAGLAHLKKIINAELAALHKWED